MPGKVLSTLCGLSLLHQPNSIVISVTHEESGWGVGLLQFC